jgi:hypothetical protein
VNDDFAHLDPTFEGLTFNGIRQPVHVVPVHPQPVQRAREVHPTNSVVPQNARKISERANDRGWNVRITHAVGTAYDNKTGGILMKAVKEDVAGELTPTGQQKKRQIGKIPAPVVNSIRVVIQTPDRILVGHWCPGWDCGLVLAGHVVESNVNWTGLEKAMTDAESRADLRSEERGGWRADQLPLDGDAGPAL